MPYQGSLPTALFTDAGIRAKDFARWRQAHSRFARGRGRATVDRYKAEIADGGLVQPIWLDVDDRAGRVYIGDGHHRAVALLEARVPVFDFEWRLCSKFSWLGQPPLESGRFPYHLVGVA